MACTAGLFTGLRAEVTTGPRGKCRKNTSLAALYPCRPSEIPLLAQLSSLNIGQAFFYKDVLGEILILAARLTRIALVSQTC